MCGILGMYRKQGVLGDRRKQALEMVRKLRHRGPDWSGIYVDEHAILAHERLAIVDVEHGAQPLLSADEAAVLAVNGEIYNHQELRAAHAADYAFRTGSDCEVILPLYESQGVDFLPELNGIYAFVLYDKQRKACLIARDPIGVIPLYWGWDSEGNHYVASEMKALVGVCTRIEEFPPGHYCWSDEEQPVRFYEPAWADESRLPDVPYTPKVLREALMAAVERQLMCDVPYGLLISGGLDSSVVAAIAAKYAERRVETGGQSPAWWPRLHSFAIGLEGSPDLAAARKVADHLGVVHHELNFTVQEGLDAISDVIYHLETYDVTTIRAATPMYLMARKIKAMGIKMLLSGEGADEIFGGYLYFHKAPNAEALHRETVSKIQQLYKFDCLRANKSTAAWGIETRVPFLDLEFLDTAMSLDPEAKLVGEGMMEKHILRQAFEGWLPDDVLWRQKEQFSDGVGYSWIDSVKAHAASLISDEQLGSASYTYPINPPQTKEAYWFRRLFAEHFPDDDAARCVPGGPSIACSTPAALAWDPSFANAADPSGRAVLAVHHDAVNPFAADKSSS